MAYFDELLQRAITVRNNRAPASNTADLVGGVLVAIVTALQMLLDDKQDELTFDTAPTADSQNPVTSDGIYQALQAIDLSACEKIVNKVTSINAQSTDVQYPSAKLLYDSLQALSGIYAAIQHTHAIADIINLQTELDARQLVSNLVTAITAQSTDQQYPSAKLLYDQLQGLAAVYAPKVHTHPFADIERPANVASVNAQGYTITTAYYSHVLTITADATLHLPTMQSGAAIILRLTIIQDATGGRAVTFDGGAALVFNPYQTDLSLGQANYRCWVVLWFDGVNWAWLASPYVLRAESQFAYTIDGTTGGQYVTVTINGTTMQIQATSGVWQYGYNNPINSIAFTGDTGVLNVDFTNSDGLANITTLADAFKNCAALVAVDFTGCDLSNVATAADCFAGCTSLAALTIPTGTWKPDIDLSACAAFTKAAMLAVIDGLYTYASGTHTVTFNSTAWNALSQADQQQVYNAADAKGWTTNAVAVTYVVRGTSSNVNGTETFNIQFIQDNAQTPDAAETITVNVDANGGWSFEYSGKKIYSLDGLAQNITTITALDFSASDGLTELTSAANAFDGCTALSAINVGSFTWKPDVILSHSPVSGVSMVAFMGNFADYSYGNQHIVRISPYSAADMGANADTIKSTLSSKNWRLPLSQKGKYTRQQLKNMVDNGYIPISSEIDFSNIGTATASLFGEDSEFYGTYTSQTNSNSILVQSWSTVNLISRDIGGIFDGNNLKIQTNYDYGDNQNAFFRNIATGGILRNIVFYGVGYAHNSNRSFVYQNDGVVEDCIVNIDLQAAVYCQAFMGNNYGTIRRCAVRAVHTIWPTNSNWSVTYLFQNNDGQVEDCILLGTYKRSNSVNVTGVMFVRSNNAGGVVERCICNAIANAASTGFGLTNNGTIVNCLENSDRNFSRVVGGTLAKTGAELIADNIGSGIYANYDPNVWTKDNDGYPTLKIEKDFDWGGDYTNITSYDALLALVKILETQLTEYTITVNATLWNSLDPSTQQAEILGILSAKNYDLTI